jgi:hypothetical protein
LEQTAAGIKPTIILTGLAVAALMVATRIYGQTWFGIGVSTRDVARSAVTEYILRHPPPPAPQAPAAKYGGKTARRRAQAAAAVSVR